MRFEKEVLRYFYGFLIIVIFFNGKGGLIVYWIEKFLGFENGLIYLIRYFEYGWICNFYYMFCDCLWIIGVVF